ncbi:MAG: hypothetical protein HY049_03695 [Acidobacteria bacterium]|nr:hypothetical protein [Acidobacteriota bacterium]
MGEALRHAPPNESVTSRVLEALDREDAARSRSRRHRSMRWVAAAAVAAAAVLGVLLLRPPGPDIVEMFAGDVRDYAAGRVTVAMKTADVRAMEGWFAANGIAFETRVFDLGMMDWTLKGGRIQRHGSGSRALFVYRDGRGRIMICQMYEGSMTALPEGGETRDVRGVRFRIFERSGITVVFWEEGRVACVLGGAIPRAEIMALAVAKAQQRS